MKNRLLISGLMIASLALFAPYILGAQDEPYQGSDQARQGNEPAPGVGRVSLAQGEVSTMRGDAGQWVASTANAPLERGDKVSTGASSRAEVQLDYANVLRLDQQSEANIADLTRSRIQVQVSQGNVNYDVLKGSLAEAEIDTPNVAVHPTGQGSYRIYVDPNSGQTEVTVRKGRAEISTPQGSTTVQSGQRIIIQGTDNPQFQVNEAPGRDQWDDWNKSRDSQILHAQSWNHTNSYYTGTEDLDRHGRWSNHAGYGEVWSPDAGPDWAPYRDGRWVWEPYYGWTWVSDEPWGWAPYHYGRWFEEDSSWYWWPGPVYRDYYPTWSPAYVSFLGFGFGGRDFSFGFGFGFGSIGWCPLGPFDSYYPWYGRGFNNYYNSVNITNINNITNITNINGNPIVQPIPPLAAGRNGATSNLQAALASSGIRRGITVVPTQNFGNGRVIRNTTPINAATLRGAQVVQGMPPVVPTTQSLSPTGRVVARPLLPARSTGAQTFFTKNQPPAGPRPFAARAAEVQQMVQKQSPMGAANRAGVSNPAGMYSSPTANRMSPQTPSRGFANAPGQTANPSSVGSNVRPGWRGFGQPAQSGTPQRSLGAGSRVGGQINQNPQTTTPMRGVAPSTGEPQARSGWQRFGGPQGVTGSQAPVAQPGRSGSQPSYNAPRQAVPAPRQSPAAEGGWQPFNQRSAPVQGGYSAPRAQPAPQPGRSISQPSYNAPRQAAPAQRQSPAAEGGWQPFNQRSAPVQSGYSAPRAQPAPSSWNRSNPEPASAPAPRSTYRPPVGMNKPIVSERAPSAYGGGYGRSAPSGGSYGGYSGGGNRGGEVNGGYGRVGGYSRAPSGGGYSGGGSPGAYSGGGGNRGGSYGGYNGGGGYSGGGRSAPSVGYSGGGNRGGSYGGYSGGGRSAPSSGSSGGGNSGKSDGRSKH